MLKHAKQDLMRAIALARTVLLHPRAFFKSMPRTGGLLDPAVFVIIMGMAAGLISASAALLTARASGVDAIVLVLVIPLGYLLSVMLVAVILYAFWRMMGSRQGIEVSVRCTAYLSALAPIAALAGLLPHVAPLLTSIWALVLVVAASREVHAVKARVAWLVFGALAAAVILSKLPASPTAP